MHLLVGEMKSQTSQNTETVRLRNTNMPLPSFLLFSLKHILMASNALGLVKTRPPYDSGRESYLETVIVR